MAGKDTVRWVLAVAAAGILALTGTKTTALAAEPEKKVRLSEDGERFEEVLSGSQTEDEQIITSEVYMDGEEQVYAKPVNLRWDTEVPGKGYFDVTDEKRGTIRAELYCNGEKIMSWSSSTTGAHTHSFPFNHDMFESGTYTFRVKLYPDNKLSDEFNSGNVSDLSPEFVYVKPAASVAVPSNLRWSSETQGRAEWDAVENAEGYHLRLLKNGKSEGGYGFSTNFYDCSHDIADIESNEFKFQVQTYSKDITKWANSEWSEPSAALGKNNSVISAEEKITKAAEATEATVDDAVNSIRNNDKDNMCRTLQSSETAQQSLGRLEETYNSKNGIQVSKSSTVDAIPVDGISVLGAGLNATEPGSSLDLNVSPTPVSPKYDTDIYKNVVTFEMKLINSKGEAKTEITNLSIPIVITLPIPQGMNLGGLFILHFKADGSVEKIQPAIIDNGKKAKFTITSLSPFAFAEDASAAKVRAFVERIYTILLGRAGDEAGINDWTNQLITKQKTGAEVALGFVMSDELRNQNISDEEYVQRLYRTFFDAEGDPAGREYWLGELKKGRSRKFVFRGFAVSDQFTEICTSFGIERGGVPLSDKDQEYSDDNLHIDRAKVEQYVDRLFLTILGRAGDPAGRQYWIDRIVNREEGAASVAMRGFFHSEEYKKAGKSDTDFTKDLYRSMMGREADADGLAYWLGQLESGGYDRDRMISHGFGNSNEFKEILQSYGLMKLD